MQTIFLFKQFVNKKNNKEICQDKNKVELIGFEVFVTILRITIYKIFRRKKKHSVLMCINLRNEISKQ